jgi:DNA-binding IclR family transcriptional regulator
LEFVATSERAVSVDDTALSLGLHRSIVYRLLRTLEARHMVERNADGDFLPGTYLAVLSRSVRRSLRAAAAPVLVGVAEELQMTAFLVVADDDEAVTVDSVEPTSLAAHVAYRPGTRHPIDRGAPGIALLAGRSQLHEERIEVTRAREAGWAQSRAEVIPGLASIAVPISDQAAIAVLWLAGAEVDTATIIDRLKAAAAKIALRL